MEDGVKVVEGTEDIMVEQPARDGGRRRRCLGQHNSRVTLAFPVTGPTSDKIPDRFIHHSRKISCIFSLSSF